MNEVRTVQRSYRFGDTLRIEEHATCVFFLHRMRLEHKSTCSWNLIAESGTTSAVSSAWWDARCAEVGNPMLGVTDTVRVDMGQVKDYFRPTSAMNLCSMMKSHNKHTWSATGGEGTFVTPKYYHQHWGGSQTWWPKSVDGRAYVSFWGGNGANGGCCHYSSTSYGGSADSSAWNRAFKVYLSLDRQCDGVAPLVPGHACEGRTLEDLNVGDAHACAAACKANAGCTCVSWHATGWSGSKRCRLEDDGGKGHTDRGNAAYSAMTMAAYDATRITLTPTPPPTPPPTFYTGMAPPSPDATKRPTKGPTAAPVAATTKWPTARPTRRVLFWITLHSLVLT